MYVLLKIYAYFHREWSSSIAICILILEFPKPINHAIWRVFFMMMEFCHVTKQNKGVYVFLY